MQNRRFQVVAIAVGVWLALLSPAFGQDAMTKPTQKQLDSIVLDLKSPKFEVRESATNALEKLAASAASAIPALLATLKERDSDVRGRALYALGRIGPAAVSTTPNITALLKDKEYNARANAAVAWGRIGPAAAVPGLIGVLKDENAFVQANAAEALGKLGLSGVVATPALIGALKSKTLLVSASAASALGTLAPFVEKSAQKMDAVMLKRALMLWRDAEISLSKPNIKNALKPAEFVAVQNAVRHLVEALRMKNQAR